jgi:hypothetical protein
VGPGETWWERLVNHEYNEVYLYYSFMQQESDPRVKAIWELHLNMELEQLRVACELMREHDGREPEQVLAPELPNPVMFEPNKEFLRELLATQIDLTTLGVGYVWEAHERFEQMQKALNSDGVPSEEVIEMHMAEFDTDYRVETDGEHPVESLRQKKAA